jgi:hypothetical protein
MLTNPVTKIGRLRKNDKEKTNWRKNNVLLDFVSSY